MVFITPKPEEKCEFASSFSYALTCYVAWHLKENFIMKRIVRFIKQKICRHEFNVEDITLTGIKPPTDFNYISDTHYHDSVTKRVCCQCRKCGAFKYAHCGLELKGKLTRAT